MMFTAIKRITGVLLFSALFYSSVFGQASLITDPSGFGHVPDSLFAKNRYPADPDVPFIYSLKDLNISFAEDDSSIVAVLRYHVRVKIFDASIKEASIVGVPYYFEDNIEQISDIRGFTYQSPTQKTPLSTDKIKTINVNSRYNVKEFTMPDVKDGSVIEYAYTIRRRYIEELPDFYLANQVPTTLAKVSITYPHYLRYSGVPVNTSGPINHFITRIDTSDVPKIFTFPQPDPVIRETWEAYHVPAVKKEAYISSLADYREKIKFQLSAFGIPRQKLENSWRFVVAEIRRKQQILKKIGDNTRAAHQGAQIAQGVQGKEAAQDSIFNFVNQKVEFSGNKAPFSSVADSAVLRGKPADQAAINQTLAAMLNGAGIEAWPLLISTRQSGQINTSFPSFFQFNGQLVVSVINGKKYFMDASFPHSQPDLIPVDTYNETGLLLKKNSYQWLNVQPAKSIFGLKIEMQATLDRQGNLKGTARSFNTGYPAQLIRKKASEGETVSQIMQEAIFDGYSDVSLSAPQLINAFSYNKPVQIDADFLLKNYAVSFTSGLKFRPMVVGYLRNNPFSDKNRTLPVTLDAPEKLDLIYDIKLPRHYHLKEQPSNRVLQLPGARFEEDYSFSGDTLHYEFHIHISRKRFSPDMYPQLLKLYNRWVQLSNGEWLFTR